MRTRVFDHHAVKAALAVWVVVSSLAATGCVSAGEAARPRELRGSDALPETCATDLARPLVVDWSAADRADLHEVEQGGVIVVQYDCNTLRVLTDCHLAGSYAYLGVTPERRLVTLESSGDIRVNLPMTGSRIAAGLSQGAGLQLALATVGKTVAHLEGTSGLTGDCKGASHFVRGVYRGAFAMESVARGQTRTVADLLMASGEGSTSAARASRISAGDPAVCATADPLATRPPGSCDIPLMLELRRIPNDPAPALATQASGAAATEHVVCPAGYVERNGVCEQRRADVAFACTPTEPAQCETQCNAGNAASCARLAYLLWNGEGLVAKDQARARELYEQACLAGVQHGCAGLGMIYKQGLPDVPVDVERAFSLEQTACQAGEMRGCNVLGVFYDDGVLVRADPARALALYERACSGGNPLACSNAGTLHRDGRGAVADLGVAAGYFLQACMQRSATGCDNLLVLAQARQAPSDAVRTLRAVYELECRRGLQASCDKGQALDALTPTVNASATP